ncbi:MAG: Mobile element protein [Sphingomonas bacterium]|uniref:hypothetical protein n=1 Tax=Sphingomonas bacterium TaxID=1895847 RepID=UPI0026328A03|nr:hypothetical protein [Sphingomonas bacterium]MDB5712596.1 Mobile element protein [Sphingomonas bacterium]
MTLSFSRYQFVWPTFLETIEAVCEGLDRAWWFFREMAKTIVPDNMSSVIRKADALNPTLVAPFLDYAQARGIFATTRASARRRTSLASKTKWPTCARPGATARPSPTSPTRSEAPSTGRARSPDRSWRHWRHGGANGQAAKQVFHIDHC